MTTQEAIEKLRTYDELEGKYNEALARIDEYERERKEIADKANKALENHGVFTDRKALTEIADMLTVKPTYLDDGFDVGDVIKDVRDGQKAVYLGANGDDEYTIISFSPDREMFEIVTVGYLNYWHKTGKHYPQINIALLTEILAELRGENDESSENSE